MKTIDKKKTINFKYYLKKHKGETFLYVFLNSIVPILSIFTTIFTARFIAEITNLNFDMAVMQLLYVAIMTITERIVQIILNSVFYNTVSKIAMEMRQDLLDRAFTLSSRTFSKYSSGLFVTRITKDPEQALWDVDSLMESFIELLTFIITIGYIALINIWIGVILLLGILGLVCFEIVRNKFYKKNQTKNRLISEKSVSLITEVVRSEKDIKSLNLEKNLRNVTGDNFREYKDSFKKTYVTNIIFWGVRSSLLTVLITGILYVGIILAKDNFITIASLMFIFVNSDTIRHSVWEFGNIVTKITDSRLAFTRMFEIYNEDKFPIEKFGNIEVEECEGNIEFKDVTFGYYSEDNEKRVDVLKNISFDIPANRTVAFVGVSGSGKTTILSLISKMYETISGVVLIDGIDIKKISKDSIRKSISLVNQFPYIFDTTIRKNLLMAKSDATEEELKKVCEMASLTEFIEQLPQKIDTMVGESGIKLSGGQKQRIAIARALLRKSKIILFDESTSSLDNISQNAIKESIDNLGNNHTVVIVAHRLSTIKNSDLIYYIEDGRIKDVGTFDEIMERNSSFQNLFYAENI